VASRTTPADLVLVGGSVLTMDLARPTATAVAVGGGRILAVGDDRTVLEHAGARARRIELAGRTLLPGFTDAHCHPVLAGIELRQCSLHDLPESRDAYLDAIRSYAAARAELDWVVGSGWGMAAFPGGTPSRADLDAAVPDRPAVFDNRDGHGAWVNSLALERAHITAATIDPPDGRIEREPNREPQGTLHEGASELVHRFVPKPTIDDVVEGLEVAQAYLHRLGITAWQDAIVDAADLAAYRRFAESGRLTGRVVAAQWWDRDGGLAQIDRFVEERARSSIGRLRATSVKLMLDGVIENFTASVLEPYLDADGRATGNRGIDMLDPGLLKGFVTRLDALGFQPHFHALGDRAVRQALDAVQAARAANGMTDTRPHLAHLQLVDPADWPRFAALGAGANIQPLWARNEAQMTELTLPFLGPGRAAFQYPFRSLQRAGARLVGGSDWMVSTPDVMQQVEVAVRRVDPDHREREPLLPDEALDLETALRAYTRGGAWANHLDDVTGSIEVGKLADLVVLDRDISSEREDRLGDARVLLTVIEGLAVHEDAALESPSVREPAFPSWSAD
jgi:predicted amidohydrolase YtcJ